MKKNHPGRLIIDGEIVHYRDSSGLETDAVTALSGGPSPVVERKPKSKEILSEN